MTSRTALMTLILLAPAAVRNHREFRLLLNYRSGRRRAAAGHHHGCRRRRRDAELFFEQLDELRGLEQRQASESVPQLR